jgi:FkbM family methyltransferase
VAKIALHENRYGQKIWLDEHESIGQAIIKKGIYDEHAIFYIEKILKKMKDSICLDIGSNIGNHALVMARFSKQVYCFEPQQDVADMLTKSIAENHLQNVKVFCLGLSDQDQILTFYKNLDGNDGSSTFVADMKAKHYETNTLTCVMGDKLLQKHHIDKIDFIKIDVEGYEYPALNGLRETIIYSRPIIMMEWNNAATKAQFEQNHFFTSILKDYEIQALTSNHHKNCWGSGYAAVIKRFFYRKLTKKRRVLTTFNPAYDYTNILLIPREKMHLLVDS